MSESNVHPVLFESPFKKPVRVEFDGVAQSSDAGLVLLKSADDALKLTSRLGSHLIDDRSPLRVRHRYEDCFKQRMFSIASGYEDANDATKMRHDPALLLSCGRDPLDPDGLASQATLSRMENAVSARELVMLSRELEDIATRMLKKRARGKKRIVIDLDPSVDPTHGAQQGALFHAFYKSWCYLPMFGFFPFEGTPDHVPFVGRLRPGNSKERRCTMLILRRIVGKIRAAFGTRQSILVRLDAGFAHPRLFETVEDLGVRYVVGMPNNDVLKAWTAKKMPAIRERAEKSGVSERSFFERQYQARSWPRRRRVILKAEATPYPDREMKDNPRCIVTNLRGGPERVYDLYCLRGDAENRIKEMKNDLCIDRTSCSSFVANQLRVLMTTAAYMLHVELRWRLRKTKLRFAQVSTLVTKLIKVSAVVTRRARRVTFQLPVQFPFAHEWRRAALELGASCT